MIKTNETATLPSIQDMFYISKLAKALSEQMVIIIINLLFFVVLVAIIIFATCFLAVTRYKFYNEYVS